MDNFNPVNRPAPIYSTGLGFFSELLDIASIGVSVNATNQATRRSKADAAAKRAIAQSNVESARLGLRAAQIRSDGIAKYALPAAGVVGLLGVLLIMRKRRK